MYKILENEQELKSFFDFMIPTENYLSPTESLFLSLATRNKYADREKLDVNLNKTFMFDRTIVSGKNRQYLYNNLVIALKRLERNDGSYKCKSKNDTDTLLDIPNDCLICYYNVNPIDSVKALLGLKEKIARIESELWTTTINGTSHENCIQDINKLHRLAEIEYSKAKSKTRWFDIDLDLEKNDTNDNNIFGEDDKWIKVIMKAFCDILKVGYDMVYIVRSFGGYHIGLNVKLCSILKKDAPYLLERLKSLVEKAGVDAKELKLNNNGIIPLPGTLQGGKLVRFVKLYNKNKPMKSLKEVMEQVTNKNIYEI